MENAAEYNPMTRHARRLVAVCYLALLFSLSPMLTLGRGGFVGRSLEQVRT